MMTIIINHSTYHCDRRIGCNFNDNDNEDFGVSVQTVSADSGRQSQHRSHQSSDILCRS